MEKYPSQPKTKISFGEQELFCLNICNQNAQKNITQHDDNPNKNAEKNDRHFRGLALWKEEHERARERERVAKNE